MARRSSDAGLADSPAPDGSLADALSLSLSLSLVVHRRPLVSDTMYP